MGINSTFEVKVGDKDSWVFRGSAKKIVITSSEGIPVRVWDQTKSKEYKNLCSPKCSKTILVNRGGGGPRRIVAPSMRKGTPVRLMVEVEEVVFDGQDPIMLNTEQVKQIIEFLKNRGKEP